MSCRTETRSICLEIASAKDAAELTIIAALAFFDDRKWMPHDILEAIRASEDPSKGPPHTSYAWTRRVLESLRSNRDDPSTYYKIVLGGERLVGGLLAIARPDLGDGEWRCEGIFLDPDYHNRGIGQAAMRAMYEHHPDAARWSLGTPEWAVRNRHFYEKMGFSLIDITDIEPETGWRSCEYENVLSQEERLRR